MLHPFLAHLARHNSMYCTHVCICLYIHRHGKNETFISKLYHQGKLKAGGKYAVIYPLFTNVCKLVFVKIPSRFRVREWGRVRGRTCTGTVLPLGLSEWNGTMAVADGSRPAH